MKVYLADFPLQDNIYDDVTISYDISRENESFVNKIQFNIVNDTKFFNPENSDGLLYKFRNRYKDITIGIYDDNDNLIFNGFVENIPRANKVVTILGIDRLGTLLEVDDVEYSSSDSYSGDKAYQSSGNPADHLLALIRRYVPDENINIESFNQAGAQWDDLNVTLNVSYEKGILTSIIRDLSLDISYIYIQKNKIHYKVLNSFDGDYGTNININQLIDVNKVDKYLDDRSPEFFQINYNSAAPASEYGAEGIDGTTTGLSATTLTDSSASFTVNEHKGKYVVVGSNNDAIVRIASNTETELELEESTGLSTPKPYTIIEENTGYVKDYNTSAFDLLSGAAPLGNRVLLVKRLDNKLQIDIVIETNGLEIIPGENITIGLPDESIDLTVFEVLKLQNNLSKGIANLIAVDRILYPEDEQFLITPLASPQNLTGFRDPSGALVVSFDAVANAVYYNIYYQTLSQVFVFNTSDNSQVSISGPTVVKWLPYNVYVRAVDKNIFEGEQSETITIDALVPTIGYIDGTKGYELENYDTWGQVENWFYALTYKVLNPDDLKRLAKNTHVIIDRSQVGRSYDPTNADASENVAEQVVMGYLDLAGSSSFLTEFVQLEALDSGTGSLVLTVATAVLTDGTQSWTIDEYKDKLIRVTKSGSSSLLCTVISNTATTITFGLDPNSAITGAGVSYTISEPNRLKNPFLDKKLTFDFPDAGLTTVAADTVISTSTDWFSRRWNNALTDFAEYCTYWYQTGHQFNPAKADALEWFKVYRIDLTLGIFDEGGFNIPDTYSDGDPFDVLLVDDDGSPRTWVASQWVNYWCGVKTVDGNDVSLVWYKITANGTSSLTLDGAELEDVQATRFVINSDPYKGMTGIFFDDVWYDIFTYFSALYPIQKVNNELISSTADSIGTTFITDTSQSWEVNELVGVLVNVDGLGYNHIVTDNTATTANFRDLDGSAGSNPTTGSNIAYMLKSHHYDLESETYAASNASFISGLMDHIEKRIKQYYENDSILFSGNVVLNTFPEDRDLTNGNYQSYINQLNKKYQNFVMTESSQSSWISRSEVTRQFLVLDWQRVKERFESMKVSSPAGDVRLIALGYPHNNQMTLSVFVGSLLLAAFGNIKEDISYCSNIVLDQLYYTAFNTKNVDGDSIGQPQGDSVFLDYDRYGIITREFQGVVLFYNPSRRISKKTYTFGFDVADYDTGLFYPAGQTTVFYLPPRGAKVFYKNNNNGIHGYLYLQAHRPYTYIDNNSAWIVFTTAGKTKIGTDSVWIDLGLPDEDKRGYTNNKRFVTDGTTLIPTGNKQNLFHAGDGTSTFVDAEDALTESITGTAETGEVTLTSKTILAVVRLENVTDGTNLEFGTDFLVVHNDGDNTLSGKGKWDTDIYFITDQSGDSITVYYYEQGLDGDGYPDPNRASFEHGYMYRKSGSLGLWYGGVNENDANDQLTLYDDYYIIPELVRWNWEFRQKLNDINGYNSRDIEYPGGENIKAIDHNIIDVENAVIIETPKTENGTADTVTATTLTDASKSWTINQWKDGILYFDGAGEKITIISNTENTLTYSSNIAEESNKIYFLRGAENNSQYEQNGTRMAYTSKTITRPRVLIFGWTKDPRNASFEPFTIANRPENKFRLEVEIKKNEGILYDQVLVTGDWDGILETANADGAWGSVDGILADSGAIDGVDNSTVAALAEAIDIVIINDTFIETAGQTLTTAGTADVTSATTLEDTSQSWTPDEWIGQYIQMPDGVKRLITDNTATVITFVGSETVQNDIDYEIFGYGQHRKFASWLNENDYLFLKEFKKTQYDKTDSPKLLIDRRLGMNAFVWYGGEALIQKELVRKEAGSLAELATLAGCYSFNTVQVSDLTDSAANIFVSKGDDFIEYSSDMTTKFKVYNNNVEGVTDHYILNDENPERDYNTNENGGTTITFIPKSGKYRKNRTKEKANLYVRRRDLDNKEKQDADWLNTYEQLDLDNISLRREDVLIVHKNDTAFQRRSSEIFSDFIINLYAIVLDSDFQTDASLYENKRLLFRNILDGDGDGRQYLIPGFDETKYPGYTGHNISDIDSHTDFAVYDRATASIVALPSGVEIQLADDLLNEVGPTMDVGDLLVLDTFEANTGSNFLLSKLDNGFVGYTCAQRWEDVGGQKYVHFITRNVKKVEKQGSTNVIYYFDLDVDTFLFVDLNLTEDNKSNCSVLIYDCDEPENNVFNPNIIDVSGKTITIKMNRVTNDENAVPPFIVGKAIFFPATKRNILSKFTYDQYINNKSEIETAIDDITFQMGMKYATVDLASTWVPGGGDLAQDENKVFDFDTITEMPGGLIPYERAFANGAVTNLEEGQHLNKVKEFAYEENTGYITGHAFYINGFSLPPVLLWQGVSLEDIHRMAQKFIGIKIDYTGADRAENKDYYLYYNSFKDLLQIKEDDLYNQTPLFYRYNNIDSQQGDIEKTIIEGTSQTAEDLIFDGSFTLDGSLILNGVKYQ